MVLRSQKNELNNVFSFETGNNDYIREYYDQHNIRILNLDDDGNISFVVYGYMNCGDYEGRVGILLYDYSVADNQITERVYLPLTTTYEQLKEDFGDFCYINNKTSFTSRYRTRYMRITYHPSDMISLHKMPQLIIS